MQELASFIAHDFRSPLAQIHSLITIMEMNPEPDFIAETGEKIKQIIELQLLNYNDLLYLFKYSAPSIDAIETKTFLLHNLITDNIEKWESIYPEYKNKIILDTDKSLEIKTKKEIFNYIIISLFQRIFPYLNPAHLLLIQSSSSAQANKIEIKFESHEFNWEELTQKFRIKDRGELVKNLGIEIYQSIAIGKKVGLEFDFQKLNSENQISISFS